MNPFLIVFIIPYFLPFSLITLVYLILRLRFSFTLKALQYIRYITGFIVSIGTMFLFSYDAINSEAGEILLFVLLPPLSGIIYLFGALFVVLIDYLVYYIQERKNKPSLTKDNLPQKQGLKDFCFISMGVGILLQLVIFGGILAWVFLESTF